ncbi:hypothetical protein D3C76_615600 [compost metagenome]
MKRALVLLSLIALPVLAAEPHLYGRYEWVGLPDLDRTLQAKMDTGAYTSSLSARDIEIFQRNGEDWVRFRLATKEADNSVYEHKLARISKIKNRADGRDEEEEEEDNRLSERPVIELPVCLGDDQRTIEVNLTDRSNFNYPFLMGAKGLRKFHVAVDPRERFAAGKPNCSAD